MIAKLTAQTLHLPLRKVEATLALLSEGATIPFIARYRKERTGLLDEVAITDIQKTQQRFTELSKRKQFILNSIEEQGKLTPELQQRLENSWDSTEIEDLYLPYKKKRKTRATTARERGLEPLAQALLAQKKQVAAHLANAYTSADVPTVEDALQGARDIIAEMVAEHEQARQKVRFAFARHATVRAKVARGKEEEGAKYRDYFDFEQALKHIPSHRLLAIRRGEEEGFLRVSIEPDMEPTVAQIERLFLNGYGEATEQVRLAITDAYKRLLRPSIETEFRNKSKEIADADAINVFVNNLRQLLLAAPLGQKRVIGIDPGYRTGCKVVVLDDRGDLLHHTAIFPHPPQKQVWEAQRTLQALVEKYRIEAIAVGNGTAGKETLALCRKIDFDKEVQIFMVNEAGASIYSASETARQEFPDKDVTVRGAVSIARRLLDPLAELVKIDPKSIGVGQYQHDVNQVKLRESLDRTVESCVNAVGINLNTASHHLLTYVSGLGPTLAQNIVQYRSENGAFTSRKELLNVPRMGAKAFEQAAGFLRIRAAKNPLDNTAVHPESYAVVRQMAADLGVSITALIEKADLRQQLDLRHYVTDTVGLPTLQDILEELAKPGLDPRGKAKTFSFATGIETLEDITIGMVLPGIVTNVTNFGAFVDVGIKGDGLVHISELANKFVKDPADVVSLGQEVEVRVTQIDLPRRRLQLSMKEV